MALLGVLGTDVVSATRLHAEAQRQHAAQVEQQRGVAYRAGVRPIAEAVFDQIQPLQDASDAYLHPGPDAFQIAGDVYARSGAHASLQALRLRLTRLHAPTSLRRRATNLSDALSAFVEATAGLEKAAHADSENQVMTATTVLSSAILTWGTATAALFTDSKAPPIPVGGGLAPGTRKPVSRGAWIVRVDTVCSGAADSGSGLPDLNTAAKLVSAGPRYAKFFRNTVRALTVVPPPAEDRARLERDVTTKLAAAHSFPDGLDALARAVGGRDVPAVRGAGQRFAQGLHDSQSLAHGYASAGATVCADLFFIPASLLQYADKTFGGAIAA